MTLENLEIQIEEVGYSYPGRDIDAVRDIDFRIKAEQKVAVVGRSGAGKSTIANLLLRFITPQTGRIWVNGNDVSRIPVEKWWEMVAWLPQRPTIFEGTLADNIRLGKPDATIEVLRIAIDNAGLDHLIAKLPLGLDTQVGERGTRLSAGECQRVALARAFLVDAPFLILDEPTSHLDIELETRLVRAIKRLCQRKTVFMIAHRIPTILEADLVVVLDKGRIIEKGTPDELLAREGYLRRLVAQGGWG